MTSWSVSEKFASTAAMMPLPCNCPRAPSEPGDVLLVSKETPLRDSLLDAPRSEELSAAEYDLAAGLRLDKKGGGGSGGCFSRIWGSTSGTSTLESLLREARGAFPEGEDGEAPLQCVSRCLIWSLRCSRDRRAMCRSSLALADGLLYASEAPTDGAVPDWAVVRRADVGVGDSALEALLVAAGKADVG